MVFPSLPPEVQENGEPEKESEGEHDGSEVPVEEVDSDSDMEEAEESWEEKGGEEKGQNQVDSIFEDSQGNESYVPVEDRPKEFSEEEQVHENKEKDLELEPVLIDDSPAKAPGDDSQLGEEEKAAEALKKEKEKALPELVLDSLPFGSDAVLRRAQLGLKAEVEGEEEGEGGSGKKPRAKAKSKGKAKGKAAPKRKSEPKAKEGAPKARGRPRKNKDVESEIEGRDQPLEEPIEEYEEPESPGPSAGPTSGGVVAKSDDMKNAMNEDTKEEEKEEGKDEGKDEGKEEEKESEKEPPIPESSKPVKRRRTKAKADVVQEKAGESEKPEETVKKTRSGDGPATFARRARPRSDYGKMKWDNLKAIFNSMIKEKVVSPSKREDLGYDENAAFPPPPEEFWEFVSKRWTDKDVNCDNAEKLSEIAGADFLDSLTAHQPELLRATAK
eukprot:s815_g14.t1